MSCLANTEENLKTGNELFRGHIVRHTKDSAFLDVFLTKKQRMTRSFIWLSFMRVWIWECIHENWSTRCTQKLKNICENARDFFSGEQKSVKVIVILFIYTNVMKNKYLFVLNILRNYERKSINSFTIRIPHHPWCA